MTNAYNIVMFGMSTSLDWFSRGVANRNYHIVRHLLQSPYVHKLLYIDYLPTTFKRTVRDYVEIKRTLDRKRNVSPHGTQFCYEIHERFFVFPSHYYKISHWMFVHNLLRVKRHLFGQKVPLLTWAYLPWSVPFWGVVKPRMTVFDSVDDLREHPSYASMRLQLERYYELVNRRADIIFTVSTKLIALYPHHPSCFWIPNGVDAKQFIPHTNPIALPYPKPIILYAGTIQDRIDFHLVQYLATRHPKKTFLFIGNIWREAAIGQLKRLPNVVFTGHIPYEKLQRYMAASHAAIMPHKITRLTESMNPLKLYEYLAAGLPVISTPVAGTEDFRNTIAIADTYREFDRALTEALATETSGKKEKRRFIVKNATWEQRVRDMFSYIYGKE